MTRLCEGCNPEVYEMLNEVIAAHRSDLAGVTFALTYTWPAPVQHGRPVEALAVISSVEDRKAGMADVEIILCGLTWEEGCEEERLATLERVLSGLTLGRKGKVRLKYQANCAVEPAKPERRKMPAECGQMLLWM